MQMDFAFNNVYVFSQDHLEEMGRKVPVKRYKLPMKGDSSKRALFDQASQESKKSDPITMKKVEPSQIRSLPQPGSSSAVLKDMLAFEWALKYREDHKRVTLYIGRASGKGVVSRGQVFSYGKLLKVDYMDEDSDSFKVVVETSKGTRELLLSEPNLVISGCQPVELRHVLSESDNMILTLEPFIGGRVSFATSDEASSDDQNLKGKQVASPIPAASRPKAKKHKQPIQNKPVKKARKEETSSTESDVPDNTSDKDLVTPGGELSTGIIESEQNTIRRQIIKSKLVKKGHIFTLPITLVHRPPIDPATGRRPLEIREPHNMHVQNLKKKMKINPHATVVPFLVMVDPVQCSSIAEFDISNPEKYRYFVIGGSHSAEARRQLVMEHPTTYFFKYAECKIYVGLSIDEAKLLAWDHNNDNDYRQKMSSIERIRFFHYEYLDALRQYGSKLHPGLRKHCLNEVGIVTDESVKSEGLRKYEPWFQLAFRDGKVWDLQDIIFSMWENKEVKGQKVKKGKVDPQVDVKGSKGKKLDFTIEEAAEDMKLTQWRALQGIKDETLLTSVLSRVISKELSLDEMVVELSK